MAKFHGKVGYIQTEETAPGVYSPITIERDYTGEILRDSRTWERKEQLNESLVLNMRFSIVSDQYAYENYPNIRYIVYQGAKWRVTGLEFQRPRIILTVGGVYNGE